MRLLPSRATSKQVHDSTDATSDQYHLYRSPTARRALLSFPARVCKRRKWGDRALCVEAIGATAILTFLFLTFLAMTRYASNEGRQLSSDGKQILTDLHSSKEAVKRQAPMVPADPLKPYRASQTIESLGEAQAGAPGAGSRPATENQEAAQEEAQKAESSPVYSLDILKGQTSPNFRTDWLWETSAPFFMSFQVNLKALPSSPNDPIVVMDSRDQDCFHPVLKVSEDGSFVFELARDTEKTGEQVRSPPRAITPLTWHSIGAFWNPSSGRVILFVDGQDLIESHVTALRDTPPALRRGQTSEYSAIQMCMNYHVQLGPSISSSSSPSLTKAEHLRGAAVDASESRADERGDEIRHSVSPRQDENITGSLGQARVVILMVSSSESDWLDGEQHLNATSTTTPPLSKMDALLRSQLSILQTETSLVSLLAIFPYRLINSHRPWKASSDPPVFSSSPLHGDTMPQKITSDRKISIDVRLWTNFVPLAPSVPPPGPRPASAPSMQDTADVPSSEFPPSMMMRDTVTLRRITFTSSPPMTYTDPVRPLPSLSPDESALQSIHATEHADLALEAMQHTWSSYSSDPEVFGTDGINPITGAGQSTLQVALLLIESLGTLWFMGEKKAFEEGARWISRHLDFNKSGEFSLFEINIRVLGGLLSAYGLSELEVFREKAIDLGDRFMKATSTVTGVHAYEIDIASPRKSPVGFCLAEQGTVQLEYRYLTAISSRTIYQEVADLATQFIEHEKDEDGLVGEKIKNTRSGKISMGAQSDSYYEYVLKQFLQTNQTEFHFIKVWVTQMRGVLRRMITKTTPSGLTYLGEMQHRKLLPRFDHLACFFPGMLILGVRTLQGDSRVVSEPLPSHWLTALEITPEELDIWAHMAEEIGRTCYEAYARTPTGIGPESITLDSKRDFFALERSYILRPETTESLFYLWHLTDNPLFRVWGHKASQAVLSNCRSPRAFSALWDVTKFPSLKVGKMESFFVAETLKYQYLLNKPLGVPGDKSAFSFRTFVLNTEAHPFPRLDGLEGLKFPVWMGEAPEKPEEPKKDGEDTTSDVMNGKRSREAEGLGNAAASAEASTSQLDDIEVADIDEMPIDTEDLQMLLQPGSTTAGMDPLSSERASAKSGSIDLMENSPSDDNLPLTADDLDAFYTMAGLREEER